MSVWLNSAFAAEIAESGAVVFMYHRFGEHRLPSTNIKMDQIVAQLDWLKKEKFHIWPLSRIVEYLENNKSIPDKVVAITIDDAYLSVYQNAFPIFKQRKIPFTVFISTDHVDKKYSNYMSWEQLREMLSHGMEVGSHSASHAHLIRTSESFDDWKQQVLADLNKAHGRIKQELGVEARSFAYPYGEFSIELATIVKQLGYVGFGQQSGAIGLQSDRRFLPRYPMSESFADLEQFSTKAKSIAMPVRKVEPLDPVWSHINPPKLVLGIDSKLEIENRVQCFASGQGSIPVEYLSENRFFVQAKKKFNTRRFRYNCTIPSEQAGRYYWYSHLWINPSYHEE